MAGEINKTYTSNSLYNDSTGVIAFAEQLKQELINWANYKHVTEELGQNRPDLQNELNNLFLSVYERFLTFLNDADASEDAINTWKEIENFLADYTDDKTLASIVAELNSRIESRLTVPLESTTGSSTTSTMTQKAITETIAASKTFTTGERVDNIGIDAEPTAGSDNLVKSGGVQNELALGAVYDVSAKNPTAGLNNDGKWESLSALLSDANLNTLIPTAVRKGGMSIKFVQSSDNKYVQYMLTSDTFTTNVNYWVECNSNTVEGKVFYVTDANRNVIAKINKDGVHSVDFRYGQEDTSLADTIENEAEAREEGDAAVTALVEAEETRAKGVENTKLNHTIEDDKFLFTDSEGFIIAMIDSEGVHAPNLFEGKFDDDKLLIMDNDGYIIAKVDRNGVHSAKDKHAVACMVLSESYYPTASPVRDGDGNVTHVEAMFETGVAGSISITYTNGNSSSVAVVYGNYNYTITINRDIDGNVETVNIQ